MGLEQIIEEWTDADREERMELLLDYANSLPTLPERFEARRDAEHRIEECMSPVYFFAEVDPEQNVHMFADVPREAPTVRGFVSMLIQGYDGSSFEDVLQIPPDLVMRMKLPEIIGMMRIRGLNAVVHRIKSEVTRAETERLADS